MLLKQTLDFRIYSSIFFSLYYDFCHCKSTIYKLIYDLVFANFMTSSFALVSKIFYFFINIWLSKPCVSVSKFNVQISPFSLFMFDLNWKKNCFPNVFVCPCVRMYVVRSREPLACVRGEGGRLPRCKFYFLSTWFYNLPYFCIILIYS